MHLSSILIAVDSVAGSRSVMQIASELAYRSDAELNAVFVEEDEWYKASSVSFTLQVSSYTGEVLPFDEAELSEQTKAHSKLLEHMLVSTGQNMNIRCSYHTARGSVIQELMLASESKDMIIIGRNRMPDGRSVKIGRTARLMVENCEKPVLLWNGKPQWPLIVSGIVQGRDSKNYVDEWTTGMGRILNRKTELIHSDETSEDFTPQKLAEDKNRLIIIKRTRDDKGISSVVPDMFPNSVLLL